MSKMIYNKLIRDRIPEIIKKDNKYCDVQILSKDKYKTALQEKLKEELKEYLDSKEIEELADIQEIIYALLEVDNISLEEFEKIRLHKVNKNGAFKKRLFLNYVEDDK